MSVILIDELLKARIADAEEALMDALHKTHRPAESLAVWLDKPGSFVALVTSFVWEVLEEMEPARLEEALCDIERYDLGQSAAMKVNQEAITAWIRSERELRECPVWKAMSGEVTAGTLAAASAKYGSTEPAEAGTTNDEGRAVR